MEHLRACHTPLFDPSGVLDGAHEDFVVFNIGLPVGQPVVDVIEGLGGLGAGLEGCIYNVLLEDTVKGSLLVKEDDPEGDLEGVGGILDALCEEEGS